MKRLKIVIKGAGELVGGVAHALCAADFWRILMIEISQPVSVRRAVSFSEAIYEGETNVHTVP